MSATVASSCSFDLSIIQVYNTDVQKIGLAIAWAVKMKCQYFQQANYNGTWCTHMQFPPVVVQLLYVVIP
jgi:hypothetical protein